MHKTILYNPIQSTMMISQTEENYLKAIYKINEREGKSVNTNAISSAMNTTAASVTDMIKRLAEKDFINYEKYKGVTLTTAINSVTLGTNATTLPNNSNTFKAPIWLTVWIFF